MGESCSCNRFTRLLSSGEPEKFIQEVLDTETLRSLTQQDISTILFNRIKGGNENLPKANSEISEINYSKIAEDILNESTRKNNNINKKQIDNNREILEGFLKGLFPLINVNNSRNAIIFKMIMFPFTAEKEDITTDNSNDNERKDEKEGQKENQKEKINAQYLLHLFKCVNFNNDKIDIKTKEVKYTILCNSFTIYLSMILVGFTKIIYSCLNENNSEEKLRKDMKDHIEKYFKKEYIIKFYGEISKELLEKFEDQTEIQLDEYIIEEDSFVQLCHNKPFILNYFDLRKEYINFVKKISNIKEENSFMNMLKV